MTDAPVGITAGGELSIGTACAPELGAVGGKVAITDIRDTAVSKVCAPAGGSDHVISVPTAVSDEAAVQRRLAVAAEI